MNRRYATLKSGLHGLCLLICFPAFMLSGSSAQSVTIPVTPDGKVLTAFLEAFNSGDKSRLEAYVKTFAPEDTVDDLARFSGQTGGFNVLSITSSKPDAISFRVRGRTDGMEAFGIFTLASVSPPKVKNWTIRLLPPGATPENITLDAAYRERTINAIKAQLTDYYIYPDVAAKMNLALAEHAKHGDYDQLAEGSAFAAALMKDLRAVSNDRHLFVDYRPFLLAQKGKKDEPHSPTPAELDTMRTRLESSNCFFSKVEILPSNIGYLKLDAFMNPGICGPTVAAAMGFLAHTSAVIVDLRSNGGGDPAMVQLVASYFFSQPTHINNLYNRHDDATTQYWTLPYVPGQRISAPLYILTSQHTFSGAEEFAYDMQTQKRATIIGETTGGGAHPVHGIEIGEHFVLGVPLERPINPITMKDWEGTGVTPDIKVSAADALTEAQKVATEKVQMR